jgi:hypothetical protein
LGEAGSHNDMLRPTIGRILARKPGSFDLYLFIFILLKNLFLNLSFNTSFKAGGID